jgi:signal transduction histidine kinase
VLVVDDEPRIVSFVSRALSAEGFQMDGARGLDLATTGGFGGSIAVVSEEGQGATFRISLIGFEPATN